MSAWTPSEPNGRGNGWRVGPAWLGIEPWSAQTKADAYLIAAAPELLEAIDRLLQHLPRYCDEDEEPLYMAAQERARYAIAKATGEAA